MTITADIDRQIAACQAAGLGLASIELRMGVGSLRALAADADASALTIMNGYPIAYCNIPIEHVEPPPDPWHSCQHHFHGFEIRIII